VTNICSTYLPFSLTPEDLERMAKESGMFYCMNCKKTFMMKGGDSKVLSENSKVPSKELKCPHCGSGRIKPRAK